MPSDEAEYTQAMKGFAPVAFIPQIAPTPLFLQFSDRDQFVSTEAAQQLAAAAGNATVTTYTTIGHDLDDATVTAERDAWLADRLNPPK